MAAHSICSLHDHAKNIRLRKSPSCTCAIPSRDALEAVDDSAYTETHSRTRTFSPAIPASCPCSLSQTYSGVSALWSACPYQYSCFILIDSPEISFSARCAILTASSFSSFATHKYGVRSTLLIAGKHGYFFRSANKSILIHGNDKYKVDSSYDSRLTDFGCKYR